MSKNELKVDDNQGIARRKLLNTLSTGLAGSMVGTTATLQAQAEEIKHVVDERIVKRTAGNISQLLVRLSTDFQASVDNLMPLRLRIFNDVVQLFNALDPADRGCLLSILTLEVDKQIGGVTLLQAPLPPSLTPSPPPPPNPAVNPSPPTPPPPAPSPTNVGVGTQNLSNCSAIGVEATSGSTTVGAGVCPASDLSSVEGGGFWARFSY